MNSRKKAARAWVALAATLFITAGASQSWGAAENNKTEAKCHAALTKAIGKHAAAVTKAMAACNSAVLDGAPGPCPDATAIAAIEKSSVKTEAVAKKCQSTCIVSDVSCIDNVFCPPNGGTVENCSGKGSFRMSRMGFPGAFCEDIIGRRLIDPEGVGECAAGLGSSVADELVENIFGDFPAGLSDSAAGCLETIAKALPSAASKLAATVAKCRNTQLVAESPALLPGACSTDDLKTADSIAAAVTKLRDAIDAKCEDADVAALSLCGAGTGGITTVLDAQNCLSDVLEQTSYSVKNAETRPYAELSIINAAYPKTYFARCGDNLVNQGPNQFALNGEECDGTDSSACPGECFPPGDVFECTCSTTRRTRAFADGFTADLDNGWTGNSHNSKVTDRAGFVADISNCDCSQFDGVDKATCLAGNSTDPNCDVFAEVQPRCEDRIGQGISCDQAGNGDGEQADADCRSCDSYAANAGEYCTEDARFCVGGLDTGERCNSHAECNGGTCTGVGTCLTGPFINNGCAGPQNCRVCVGGLNDGNGCAVPGDCSGGTCANHVCATKFCVGGDNVGAPCANDSTCTGTGGRCAETNDCDARCYAETDFDGTTPLGACWSQADCADGQRCRGVCQDNTCLKIRNGAPLPLSSAGVSVCIDSQFASNISGTRNILTGAHEINYNLKSLIILGEINGRPCPVCGGFCDKEENPGMGGERCEGTCTGPELACRTGLDMGATCVTNTDCDGGNDVCTGVACRFDTDCATGTCNGTASPECHGTTCRLDLACSSGGTTEGQACRIEAYTAFGTTSVDCPPPAASKGISGTGLNISWTPLTSGPVTLEQPAPCNESGWENYDCNCVTGGGSTKNRPNKCEATCTDPDPQYFGRQCSGYTTCVGGGTGIHGNGASCDEDSDCNSNDCSGNPKVCGAGSTGVCSIKRCVGGASNGNTCFTNDNCEGGTCPLTGCTIGGAPCAEGVCDPTDCSSNPGICDNGASCDDACPSGLCVPLCLPRGKCDIGDRVGLFCALDADCPGGGTCVPDDAEEGACANGGFNHCSGPGWEFQSCPPTAVGTQRNCEAGDDGALGDPNGNAVAQEQAVDNRVGAGYCQAEISHCFINDGFAEGGTTLNGRGDPTNSLSVATFCIAASTSTSVNPSAGLPGPGRIRQRATVVPNFSVLP